MVKYLLPVPRGLDLVFSSCWNGKDAASEKSQDRIYLFLDLFRIFWLSVEVHVFSGPETRMLRYSTSIFVSQIASRVLVPSTTAISTLSHHHEPC